MWSWKDWKEQGGNLPDLSFQRNQQGSIPLECNGLLRNNQRCKTKLQDGLKKKGTRLVFCNICGWRGERVVGRE